MMGQGRPILDNFLRRRIWDRQRFEGLFQIVIQLLHGSSPGGFRLYATAAMLLTMHGSLQLGYALSLVLCSPAYHATERELHI